MRRELPKNVRQIGNVCDSSKIYIEDYVDTFLNQLCEKADQASVGAFLVGQIEQDKDEDYIYVYGAIRMQELVQKGRDVFINEGTWKHACETCKQYFGDAEILGWFLTSNGQALETNHNLMKIHQKFFPREKSVFILKEAKDKEEKYFVYKFKDLMEINGHYIYYEKNIEMQDYMIASRKKNGMTSIEIIEDGAAKNFRNVIRQKMSQTEQKSHSRYVYVLSTFLVLVVVVVGITMMNNYDKLRDMKNSISQLKGAEDAVEALGNIVSGDDKEPEEDEPELQKPEEQDNVTPETPDDSDSPTTPQTPENPDKPATSETPDTADTPEPSDAPAGESVYVVQKGDTLASISQKEYGDLNHVNAICELNGLEDGNLIMIGQKLLLP